MSLQSDLAQLVIYARGLDSTAKGLPAALTPKQHLAQLRRAYFREGMPTVKQVVQVLGQEYERQQQQKRAALHTHLSERPARISSPAPPAPPSWAARLMQWLRGVFALALAD